MYLLKFHNVNLSSCTMYITNYYIELIQSYSAYSVQGGP